MKKYLKFFFRINLIYILPFMELKEKFEIEFPIHASPYMLYQYISSASGLCEWFADDVNSRGKSFSFLWVGSEEIADLISSKYDSFVKYRWMDESDDQDKCFFEIRIVVDEITKDVSLMVTDFAYSDEDTEINAKDVEIAIKNYKNPIVKKYPGGHFFSSGIEKKVAQEFINNIEI